MISLPPVSLAFYFGGAVAGSVGLLVMYLLCRQIYLSAHRIMIRWYGCEDMHTGEFGSVHRTLQGLAGAFSVQQPRPHVFDSSVPVVFTVGSKKRNDIVMSRGLLELLDDRELEAVLAREMARISEGHVAQNTFVALVGGVVASFATVTLWISMLGGFGQEYDPAPKFIRFVAMGVVMLPAALIVYLGSTDSTLSSDLMAARKLGNRENLISALKRVHTDILLHAVEYFNPAHVNLFVMNPVKVNSLYDVHMSLFHMRPDLSQRIKALEGADLK